MRDNVTIHFVSAGCLVRGRDAEGLCFSYIGPELESCMIKLPLSAFGFTIKDKTFGFQLFHVSTFFSFQIFISSAFGF